MKKKIMQRTALGFIIGIAIGQIICVLISLMNGNGEFVVCTPYFTELIGSEAMAAAIQTFLCGIMGSGFSAASVIWEMDDLSIAVQSGICFGIYAAVLLPIAYFAGWMEHSVAGVMLYTGIFIASYVIVWAVQYCLWKNRLRSINAKLNG